jgi:hypothetical protein
VTGRLAARHGIKVTLRPSPFGGTTAIVLLPKEIITSAVTESPANLGRGQAFGITGRHRISPSALTTGAQANGATGADGVAVPELPSGEPPIAAVAAAAAGWLSGPAAPARITEPAKAPGPDGANESNGSNGHSRPDGPGQAANGTAGGGTHRGLPRRVRQANLAPQLRAPLGDDPLGAPLGAPLGDPLGDPLGPAQAETPYQAGGPAGRSPEQAASLMSEMQAGWLRGRLDDLDSPDAGLDLISGRSAGATEVAAVGGDADSDDREGGS